MPKYSEVDKYVSELREMADFIEKNGVRMPDFYMTNTLHISLTETTYDRDEITGEYETKINEIETKQTIKKLLDCLDGHIDKDYRDDRLIITKKFSHGDRNMIVGTVDRSVACKRKVTGKKFIKEHLVPSRFEEEVEWVCDEGLSLKKLVANV